MGNDDLKWKINHAHGRHSTELICDLLYPCAAYRWYVSATVWRVLVATHWFDRLPVGSAWWGNTRQWRRVRYCIGLWYGVGIQTSWDWTLFDLTFLEDKIPKTWFSFGTSIGYYIRNIAIFINNKLSENKHRKQFILYKVYQHELNIFAHSNGCIH